MLLRCLTAITLALLLSACGGGGGSIPVTTGLTPLSFELTSDPGSVPAASEVDGFRVDMDHPDYAGQLSNPPNGQEVVDAILLTPETSSGFSGQIEFTSNKVSSAHSASALNSYLLYYVNDGNWILQGEITVSGNDLESMLKALGLLAVTRSSSSQFTVSAFADLSETTTGTVINFWAVSHNAVDPVSYSWNFGDGQSATGDSVSHAYAAAGDYSVSLSAVDGSGTSAPVASTPIVITSAATPLTSVTLAAIPPEEITFPATVDMAATIEGGTAPFTIEWDYDGDGTFDETAPAANSHNYPSSGFYELEVRVTDANGDQASDVAPVDLRVLTLSIDDSTVYAGEEAQFTLESLGLTGEDQLTVDYGDGQSSNSPPATFTHVYTTPASYIAFAESSRTFEGTLFTVTSNSLVVTVSERPEAPVIQLTQPINPEPGGNFTIHGYGFGSEPEDIEVRIDDVPVPVITIEPTILEVQMPGGLAEDVPLSVTNIKTGDGHVVRLYRSGGSAEGVQGVLPRVPSLGSDILIVGHGMEEGTTVSLDGDPLAISDSNRWLMTCSLQGNFAADVPLDLVVTPPSGTQIVRSITLSSSGQGTYPVLQTVSPSLAPLTPSGHVVLIGHDFDEAASLVLIDGLVLDVAEWSETTADALHPDRPVDAWVAVLSRQLISNGLPLTLLRQPQITGVAPPEASPGTRITISGENFGLLETGDRVLLGSIELIVNSWNDTLIQVTLPDTAEDGDLLVKKRLDSNAWPFNVLPAPPDKPDLGEI